MPRAKTNKGKQRAVEDVPIAGTSSSSSPLLDSEPPHPTKRPRNRSKAETRPCPICDEPIPLRLLERHAELESERIEVIIKRIGSVDVLDETEPGPSSYVRRAALKARKSFQTKRPSTTHDQAFSVLQHITKNRKERMGLLKQIITDEEQGAHSEVSQFTGQEIKCPICCVMVRGDPDIVDAHIDACLVHESRRVEEAREREALDRQRLEEEEMWQEYDSGQFAGNIRGAGFHTRDTAQQDTEEDIDIDGDAEAAFGDTQFTEADVIPVHRGPAEEDQDEDIDIEGDEDQSSQRPTGSRAPEAAIDEASTAPTDGASMIEIEIRAAKRAGDKDGLIRVLEQAVKQLQEETLPNPGGATCRICLDPYKEATVSTGCWHTCCRECWLRCLGSTKLCPICKRITCATELRRIYL